MHACHDRDPTSAPHHHVSHQACPPPSYPAVTRRWAARRAHGRVRKCPPRKQRIYTSGAHPDRCRGAVQWRACPSRAQGCADKCAPGFSYCTHRRRVPASCVPHVPEAQGSLPWAGCCTHAVRVPASGVPCLPRPLPSGPYGGDDQRVPCPPRPCVGVNQRTLSPQALRG